MSKTHSILLSLSSLGLLLLLAACGPTASQVQTLQTVTINPTFQSQVSPQATVPPYRCGAWASTNAPHPNSTITIFARLTHNIAGVSVAPATAVVHFKDGDQSLDQQPNSDSGGYVLFTLSLQDRQPVDVPVTVDVTFHYPGGHVTCTAFFTPM